MLPLWWWAPLCHFSFLLHTEQAHTFILINSQGTKSCFWHWRRLTMFQKVTGKLNSLRDHQVKKKLQAQKHAERENPAMIPDCQSVSCTSPDSIYWLRFCLTAWAWNTNIFLLLPSAKHSCFGWRCVFLSYKVCSCARSWVPTADDVLWRAVLSIAQWSITFHCSVLVKPCKWKYK